MLIFKQPASWSSHLTHTINPCRSRKQIGFYLFHHNISCLRIPVSGDNFGNSRIRGLSESERQLKHKCTCKVIENEHEMVTFCSRFFQLKNWINLISLIPDSAASWLSPGKLSPPNNQLKYKFTLRLINYKILLASIKLSLTFFKNK